MAVPEVDDGLAGVQLWRGSWTPCESGDDHGHEHDERQGEVGEGGHAPQIVCQSLEVEQMTIPTHASPEG